MFTDFYRAFYYTVLLFSTGISLLFFSRVNKTFRWLCVLLVLTLLSELISRYFSLQRKPNGIVYIIFTPVEYLIYAVIFNLFLADKLWTKIIFASVACLIILEAVNTEFIQGLATPTNIMNAEGVLLVVLSLKLFITISEKPVYENVLKESVFWFNSAVLIYYAFDVLIWGLHSLVYRLKDPPRVIYQLLLLFSGLLYLAFTASVLLNYLSNQKTLAKR